MFQIFISLYLVLSLQLTHNFCILNIDLCYILYIIHKYILFNVSNKSQTQRNVSFLIVSWSTFAFSAEDQAKGVCQSKYA